ncbi:hypothetical protein O5O45_26315 [Hahella aquimaris]|uniref:glycine cleavage system protein H n=1 Tax=Hahella sp. HNIBRBA332 TaxID=3015983 RepID=UPI00273B4B2F|nr:hypothetical protein [Hahella sp. HNIBRBA332]WLQ13249.1 hypothetical protein O5O45_26315 [Hahella sp. HNIBRBA332]
MSHMIPRHLRYSLNHQWVRTVAGFGLVGITEHTSRVAAAFLADVPIDYERFYKANDKVGAVVTESGGKVPIITPLSGYIVSANDGLTSSDIAKDTYGTGWLFIVKISEPQELRRLLTADQYQAFIESKIESLPRHVRA